MQRLQRKSNKGDLSSHNPRVLVIQTAYLGDVILSTPLIRRVREHLPDAVIDYLVDPRGASAIETNPFLRKVMVYDKYGKDSGVRGFVRWGKALRERNYDIALVIHQSLRSALISRLIGIPRRIGFSTSAGSWFFTDVVQYNQDRHEIDRNLELLSPLGKAVEGCSPRIYPDAEDEQRVGEFLKKCGIKDDELLVGMAPGSAWQTKRWLSERYAELIRILAREKGFSSILFGSTEDRSLCDFIQKESGVKCFIAAGNLSPRQSAAAMRRTKALITNDSGALHLGLAAPTKVAAIFGPTVPAFGFAPYGSGHLVIELPLECRPCSRHGTKECPLQHFRCMRELTVEMVYRAIKPLLD